MAFSLNGVITISTSAAISAVRALAGQINSLQTSTGGVGNVAVGAFNKLEKSILGSYHALQHFNKALSTLKSALAIVASIGIPFKTVADQITRFQAFISTMSVTTGSIKSAREEFEYLIKVSDRLGIAVEDVQRNYAQFAAAVKDTSLKGEETRKIFENLALATRALHLSNHDTQLFFYAITQMASKGVVSMEELRRQLGEKLPGALQIAARSVNTDVQTLEAAIRKGAVDSVKFLPIYAEAIGVTFAGAAVIASKALDAEINRMKNSWTKLIAFLYDSGLQETFTKIVRSIVNVLNDPALQTGIAKVLDEIATSFGDLATQISAKDIVDGLRATASGISTVLDTMVKLMPVMNFLISNIGTLTKIMVIGMGFRYGKVAGGAAAILGVGLYDAYSAYKDYVKSNKLSENRGASGSWGGPTIKPYKSNATLEDVLLSGGKGKGKGKSQYVEKYVKDFDKLYEAEKSYIERARKLNDEFYQDKWISADEWYTKSMQLMDRNYTNERISLNNQIQDREKQISKLNASLGKSPKNKPQIENALARANEELEKLQFKLDELDLSQQQEAAKLFYDWAKAVRDLNIELLKTNNEIEELLLKKGVVPDLKDVATRTRFDIGQKYKSTIENPLAKPEDLANITKATNFEVVNKSTQAVIEQFGQLESQITSITDRYQSMVDQGLMPQLEADARIRNETMALAKAYQSSLIPQTDYLQELLKDYPELLMQINALMEKLKLTIYKSEEKTWVDGVLSSMKGFGNQVKNEFDLAKEGADIAFNSMSDAIDNLIDTGKLNFKDLVSSILKDITKLMTQNAFKQVIGGLGQSDFMKELFSGIGGTGKSDSKGQEVTAAADALASAAKAAGISMDKELATGITKTVLGQTAEVAAIQATTSAMAQLTAAAQQAATSLSSIMGGSSGGSGLGSFVTNLFGQSSYSPFTGSVTQGMSNFSSMPFDQISAFSTFFANGGIMTPFGELALNKYSTGGVANTPQVSVFGEGRTPEAYVPLPDGRNIPVKVEGNAGNTVTQNININISASNGKVSKDSIQQLQTAVGAATQRAMRRNT